MEYVKLSVKLSGLLLLMIYIDDDDRCFTATFVHKVG